MSNITDRFNVPVGSIIIIDRKKRKVLKAVSQPNGETYYQLAPRYGRKYDETRAFWIWESELIMAKAELDS